MASKAELGSNMTRAVAAFAIAFACLAAVEVSASVPVTTLREYTRASWTERDGMPSSLVWAIVQDSDGYLWLATDGGLIRFDGVRFVQWEASGGSAIAIGAVRAVLASRTGDLWVGGAGGVSQLRGAQVMNYGARDGVPERVVALFEDRQGTVWAGGFVGLSRFRNGHWEKVGNTLGLSADASVTSFYEDRDRTLWIVTSLGIFFHTIREDRFKPLLSNLHIRAVSEDSSGAMWVVTEESIRKLSDPERAIKLDRAQARLGTRMLRDRQGNFWIGTLGYGVMHVSSLGSVGSSGPIKIESLAPRDGLTSGVVQSLFEDREGNIWVGTQSGLNRLSASSVSSVTTHASGGAIEAVRAVTSGKDGTMWVGTSNGLLRVSGADSRRYDERDGLPSVAVGAVHSDPQGVLWVATDLGGLSRFKDGKFSRAFDPTSPHYSRMSLMRSHRPR